MKIVKCDICGAEVEKACDSVEPKNFWVKSVSTFVGLSHDDKSKDYCNFCYQAVQAFIDLLTEKKGNLAALFLHQKKPSYTALMDKIYEMAQIALARRVP